MKLIDRIIENYVKRRLYRKFGNPHTFSDAVAFVLGNPRKGWRKRLWYARHTKCRSCECDFTVLQRAISFSAFQEIPRENIR